MMKRSLPFSNRLTSRSRSMVAAPQPQASVPPYDPPANQRDFKNPASFNAWDLTLRRNFWQSIWGIPDGIAYRLPDVAAIKEAYKSDPNTKKKKSYLQFFPTHQIHAMAAAAQEELITKRIPWTGFPKRITDSPGSREEHYKEAEQLGYSDDVPLARQMDEYCEWFSKYDPVTKKLTRLDITCESPEYWQFLYMHERKTCLELYHKYISDKVTEADLEDDSEENPYRPYNIYNKWNTTAGAMHLNCPPNSLFAELFIAAEASTRWGKCGETNPKPITGSDALVECADYGVATRASDPTIGAQVNQLIRAGFVVGIANPVGLYLQDLVTDGWQDNNGDDFTPEQIKEIVSYPRGSPGMNLRISIEIPRSWGYTLGDTFIGGEPIKSGSHIIDKMVRVFLTGIAMKGTQFVPEDANTKAVVPCKKKRCWGRSVKFPPYPPKAPVSKPLV